MTKLVFNPEISNHVSPALLHLLEVAGYTLTLQSAIALEFRKDRQRLTLFDGYTCIYETLELVGQIDTWLDALALHVPTEEDDLLDILVAVKAISRQDIVKTIQEWPICFC